MGGPGRTATQEGLELGLGSMHFGHHWLARELMPLLSPANDTRPSRVPSPYIVMAYMVVA